LEIKFDDGLGMSHLSESMSEAETLVNNASTMMVQNGCLDYTKITPEVIMHAEALLRLLDLDTTLAVDIQQAKQASINTILEMHQLKVLGM
jgi:hypothetical protein